MGVESDRIEEGEHAGLRLFSQEEVWGLDLDLMLENQKKAQICEGMDCNGGLSDERRKRSGLGLPHRPFPAGDSTDVLFLLSRGSVPLRPLNVASRMTFAFSFQG